MTAREYLTLRQRLRQSGRADEARRFEQSLAPFRRRADEFPALLSDLTRLDEWPTDGSIEEALEWAGLIVWRQPHGDGDHLWDSAGNHFVLPSDFAWP